MNELENIKDDIQNIAEAILSVINIDVTIVDDKFIRIAGTGKYIDKIGDKVDGYSALQQFFSRSKEKMGFCNLGIYM